MLARRDARRMDRLKGFGLLALAALACPCHLPLLLGVLDGTSIGAVLAANVRGCAFVLLTGVFVGAVAIGLRALEVGSDRACAHDGARSTP
jgi:mercuric ion transport protein